MKRSQAFWKTRKEAPADEAAKNASLLIRAGYVRKEMAGVYTMLPLGRLVMNRLVAIVRDEMEKIGGEEVSMTTLQTPELWSKTNRFDDKVVDNWFKTKLASGAELGLALTHEEPMTDMMREYVSSYRDLPRFVFQFQTKFRNELRAKSGLIRGREFLMKDLYSFSRTQEEHVAFYERAAAAYMNVFARVGLKDRTYRTYASGGIFSKDSDEFQVVCDAGEDKVYVSEEKGVAINDEMMNDETLERFNITRDELKTTKCVEAGNIFSLGTRFSEPLELFYKDEAGERHPVIMGSYGIGMSRLMGIIVECLSDEKGIVWPLEVAPFAANLVLVGRTPEAREKAEALYTKLRADGVDVLFDDREGISAGERFADAELLGIPMMIVVGDKGLEEETFEVKSRATGEASRLTYDELISKVART